MNKSEVLERLCALVTKVGSKVYNDEVEHDCFCHFQSVSNADYRCVSEVIDFIEHAVNQRIDYGDIEPR